MRNIQVSFLSFVIVTVNLFCEVQRQCLSLAAKFVFTVVVEINNASWERHEQEEWTRYHCVVIECVRQLFRSWKDQGNVKTGVVYKAM